MESTKAQGILRPVWALQIRGAMGWRTENSYMEEKQAIAVRRFLKRKGYSARDLRIVEGSIHMRPPREEVVIKPAPPKPVKREVKVWQVQVRVEMGKAAKWVHVAGFFKAEAAPDCLGKWKQAGHEGRIVERTLSLPITRKKFVDYINPQAV